MVSRVLVKTFIYTTLLLVGYIFKKKGIFKKEDSRFLTAAILFLTMPAVAVKGFQGAELSGVLAVGFLVGMTMNLLLLFLGQAVSRKRSASDQAVFAFSCGAFNIGNFAIPFLTGMVTSNGFVAICMFDISVAVCCYGVNVAVAEARMGGDGKLQIKPMLKKIFTTPILITYLVLVALSLANIQLPGMVLELAEVMGNANAFLAMVSIGILFELKIPKQGRAVIAQVLGLRYGLCLAAAAVVWLLLPLPVDIRKALCVLLMAPCASSAPLLTEKVGADSSLAAAINSISIPISIALMAMMLMIL